MSRRKASGLPSQRVPAEMYSDGARSESAAPIESEQCIDLLRKMKCSRCPFGEAQYDTDQTPADLCRAWKQAYPRASVIVWVLVLI